MSALIRIGVLGAGRWGPNLIRNFHDHGKSEVVRVADPDAARRALLAPRYPDIPFSASPADVLADETIDAVVIATPTSTHHALAREALTRGKHVLVEKPIAASSRDAEDLCDLAARSQRILMVGHVFVYNNAIRWAKARIADGLLGRLHYIAAQRTNLGPIRTDVNAAWDLAAHDLSIVQYWLGREPLTASALGGAWLNPGIEDAVFATLRYPDDVLVNLHVSWLNPRKVRHMTVVGEARMLTVDDMSVEEPVRVYDRGVAGAPVVADTFGSFRACVREGDITIPRVGTGEPLRAECEHFVGCIENGSAPETGGREGLAVVRALDAIARSIAASGREEKV
ncbi:MAG: Gfo/Idh/MocA family oxidoreductase [Acidobacteriota bacterium]